MPIELQFEAEKNSFIQRSFVGTADQNYMLARWAALNRLHLDFFWMGLHATEKYLKAILLFNGGGATMQSHDIVKLSSEVLALDTRLQWREFRKPVNVGPGWHEEKIADYITRLNRRGNPHNRYLLYGFYFQNEDLLKLDQIVWQIRRHCRPFIQRVQRSTGVTEIDYVDLLQRNPKEWRLGPLPLEEALEGTASSPTLALADAVRAFNEPFAPTVEHDFSAWDFVSSTAQLPHWYEMLRDKNMTEEQRLLASKLLQWTIGKVGLSREDKRLIKKALADFDASRR